MNKHGTQTARQKQAAAASPDARFVALARLLARRAARQHLADQNGTSALPADSAAGYDEASPPEEMS